MSTGDDVDEVGGLAIDLVPNGEGSSVVATAKLSPLVNMLTGYAFSTVAPPTAQI